MVNLNIYLTKISFHPRYIKILVSHIVNLNAIVVSVVSIPHSCRYIRSVTFFLRVVCFFI